MSGQHVKIQKKILSSRFKVSAAISAGGVTSQVQQRRSSQHCRIDVSIAYVATENIVVNVLSEAFHFIPFPTGDPSSDNNNNDQLPKFCYHLCTLLHFIYPIPFFNRSQSPFHLLVGTEPSSGFHYTESDCIK